MVRDAPENPLLRRQRLLLRSTELRMAMASHAQGLKAPLALADRVRAGLQWLHRHPEWPVGILVAVAVLRPQRALRWAGRLWWGWSALKRAQSWLAAAPLRRL